MTQSDSLSCDAGVVRGAGADSGTDFHDILIHMERPEIVQRSRRRDAFCAG